MAASSLERAAITSYMSASDTLARACWFRVLSPSLDSSPAPGCSSFPSSPSPRSILVLALLMWVVASETASLEIASDRVGSRMAEMKSTCH